MRRYEDYYQKNTAYRDNAVKDTILRAERVGGGLGGSGGSNSNRRYGGYSGSGGYNGSGSNGGSGGSYIVYKSGDSSRSDNYAYVDNSARHKTFKQIVIRRLIVLGIVAIMFFGYLELFISPVIRSVAVAQVDNLTVKSLNTAVREEINNGYGYNDFINTLTDNTGRITMLQANTAAINRSVLRIAYSAQLSIDSFGRDGIELPLGVFTGVALLAGFGPDLNIRVNTVGHVYVNFYSSFVGQGINQTRHRIYVQLTSTVSIVVPTITNAVRTQVQVLLTESIIVGEIPDFVWGGFLNNN
ncbi:MAG: sporulation protein YunB [Firmicutes bacterium]|nr:sporulation protein YunB [Bacillota bacterium]